ncbi:MAG TPA: L,D-transpeptidase [Candidatus Omnitrophica bacterium]|nr:L,D-transpeptidase [Candidatus Omnitrophota bacterium]
MNKRLIIIVVVLTLGLGLFISKGRKQSSSTIVETATQTASARKLFEQAKRYAQDNELLLSKALYQDILNNHPDYPQIQDVQEKIENLNMNIIFSPTLITDASQYYEVKPGDTLIKIAKKFNTTVGLIKKINMLKSTVIHPRRKLKIWTAGFSLLVDKSQNILLLNYEQETIKTYVVATGMNNSTPVGNFKIVNKLVDPVWFRSDVGAVVPSDSPENILGSRWMGFDIDGYGIHGTTKPESIGSQATKGCIRMKNEEVEELFMLIPVGAEVTIIN